MSIMNSKARRTVMIIHLTSFKCVITWCCYRAEVRLFGCPNCAFPYLNTIGALLSATLILDFWVYHGWFGDNNFFALKVTDTHS